MRAEFTFVGDFRKSPVENNHLAKAVERDVIGFEVAVDDAS